MFNPYEIVIRNFMSFGNNETRIRLDFTKPTLIVGQNYDSAVDGQVDSNGAGKTTILNALTYCLYDNIIAGKGVKVDDLINNINKKDLYVGMVFDLGGSTFYKVERFRKNKAAGGTGVRIFERVGGKWDDEFTKDHDITPAGQENEKIRQIMKMAFEVFSRIVAFSATHNPFLSLPLSEQTEIIEEICGLTELTEKADLLKKQSKETKQQVERLEEINSTIKAQRGQILQQIDSAKAKSAAWDVENDARVQSVVKELKALSSIDFDEQLEYFEYVQKVDGQIEKHQTDKREFAADRKRLLDTITKAEGWQEGHDDRIKAATLALTKFQKLDFDAERKKFSTLADMKNKLRDARSELSAKQSEKAIHDKAIAEKNGELAHLRDATCPYCSQQFKDATSKIVPLETQIEMLQQKSEKVHVVIDGIELNINDYTASIAKLTGELPFASEAELATYEKNYNAAVYHMETYSNEVNPYSDVDVVKLKEEVAEIDDGITKLDSMITKKSVKRSEIAGELQYTSMKELTTGKAKVDSLRTELDRLNAATNPLVSTVQELMDIKLEETKDAEIAELEDLIEHQQFLVKLLTKKDSFVRKVLLQKSVPFMNTRLRYYLDKLGLQHKVGFQEDLTVKISQFGNTIGFGNLSSGQKARINLGLAFTFRDMLQARFGKLKFCILDECLDVGLGTVGVQLAAKMIKSVASEEKLSMFIISHRDEIANMFDRKLVVELRGGMSNVVTE